MIRLIIIILLNQSLHLAFVDSSHAGTKTGVKIDNQQVLHADSKPLLTNRQKPVVLWRRMGAPAAQSVGPAVQANPATNIHPSYLGMNGLSMKHKAIGNQTQPKRVLRRRRIKTVLPVGLSSWILGGIRDLDGRHWHLPADVMNRLAVNDIDLHHEIPISSIQAPGSGSVEILSGDDNHYSTTYSSPGSTSMTSSSSSATHKPATRPNQLVPR